MRRMRVVDCSNGKEKKGTQKTLKSVSAKLKKNKMKDSHEYYWLSYNTEKKIFQYDSFFTKNCLKENEPQYFVINKIEDFYDAVIFELSDKLYIKEEVFEEHFTFTVLPLVTEVVKERGEFYE